MNTYEIDVNIVDAKGSAKGRALQAEPNQMEIDLSTPSGKVENALVTWKFWNLPAGVTPEITFDLPNVIAAGPTTTRGATPQVTFEIRFPAPIHKGVLEYTAQYKISLSSGSTKKSETFPQPVDGPSLVVVRPPDPPGGGTSINTTSHAGA